MWNFPKAMLAAVLVAATTPAAAATVNPGTVADVRCIMTMVVLSQNKDNAAAAQAGLYFFGGRISARDPNADLASIMKGEAPTISNKAAIEGEAKRCGPMINAAMQSVQTGLSAVVRPPTPPPGAAAPPAAPPGIAAPKPPAAAPPK
jgi:hypothetical protein